MSGDSKDFDEGGEDLLSELLDLEAQANDQTEVVDEATSKASTSSEGQAQEDLNDFLFDHGDQTEFSSGVEAAAKELEADEELQHLDEFELATALNSIETSDEAQSETSGNPFEEPQVERTLTLGDADSNDETISAGSERSHEEAFEDLFENVDPETVLESEKSEPLLATPAPSLEELDPIDAALAEFSEDNRRSQQYGDLEDEEDFLSSASELEVSQARVDQSASEVSAPQVEVEQKDFSEVFQSGPIEVPQESGRYSSARTKVSRKLLYVTAASLFFVGSAGASYWFLKREAGVLGYRLEGFALVPAYIAPTEQDLVDFSRIMEASRVARQKDAPQEMRSQIPALESILLRDERNLAAALELREVIGRVLVWYGVDNDLLVKFDEVQASIEKMKKHLEDQGPYEQNIRAEAWKALALGEFSKSRQALTSFVQSAADVSSDARALIFELAYRSGDESAAKAQLSHLSKTESKRALYMKALFESDSRILAQLARESYLPAQIHVELSETPQGENEARRLLSKANQLFEEAQGFPSLAKDVQSFRGDIYLKLGDQDQARKQWQEVVKAHPEAASVWERLAVLYRSTQDWEEAISAYSEALKTNFRLDLSIDFARLLREQNRIVEALDILEKAIQSFPSSAELLYEQGVTRMQIFQDAGAKASLEKSLELDAEYARSQIALAHLAMRRQDFTEAERLFSEVPATSPVYSEALLGKAQLAFANYQLSQAERLFGLSLQENPRNLEAYEGLTKILVRNQKFEEAAALNTQAANLFQDSPRVAINRARIYLGQSKLSEAETEIAPYLEKYSHLSALWYIQAEVFIRRGEYSEARQLLAKWAESAINDAELAYLRAKLFYEHNAEESPLMGSRQSAESFIESALDLRPTEEKYLLLSAQIYYKLDDREETRNLLEKTLRHYPDSWQAHVLMGNLERDQGLFSRSLESFQKALKLSRFKGEIYKEIAGVYRAQNDTQNALAHYQKTLRWFPNDSRVHLEIGRLLNEEGKFLAALESLQTAARLNPKLAEAHYYLGFLQKDLGDFRSAIRSFRRYLEQEPNGVEADTIRDEIFFLEQSASAN